MFRPRVVPGFWQKLRGWFWPAMGWRRLGKYIIHRLARVDDSSQRLARGFACGVAISFTPLFGAHLLLSAALAWLLRGNIVAALLGTIVGNPVTFPLMWAVTYPLGLWLITHIVPSADPMALVSATVAEGMLSDMQSGGFFDVLRQDGFFLEFFLPWLLGSVPWVFASWFVSMYSTQAFIDAIRKQRERRQRKKQARRVQR